MTDIPMTMRAIDPSEAGGPEILTVVARAVPVAGQGEVLIRVAAAGINRPDVLQRQGKYPPPPGAPSILGLEVAGEVIAVGVGVGSEMLGTSVCALVAGGGYAEYCVAPAAQCLRIPDGLTMVEAAAIPETLFTVWTNVFQRGRAVHGETMLVHGGTSGIGTMAIALGKAMGMTVITTAGTAEKCARAEAIGAAHAINYRAQDFVTEVQRVTDGRGCDLVLDMVGGDYVARNLACLAVEGRHISIAMLNGAKAEVFIPAIMQKAPDAVRIDFTSARRRIQGRSCHGVARKGLATGCERQATSRDRLDLSAERHRISAWANGWRHACRKDRPDHRGDLLIRRSKPLGGICLDCSAAMRLEATVPKLGVITP